MPSKLGADGSVTFTDGQHISHVDTVMFCTGYLYSFPFLNGIVGTADNRYVDAIVCFQATINHAGVIWCCIQQFWQDCLSD